MDSVEAPAGSARERTRLLAGLAVALAFAVVAARAYLPSSLGSRAVVREPPFDLPQFDAIDADGRRFCRENLLGRVTVVNVASLACAACRSSLRNLSQLQHSLPERSIEFVTLFALPDDSPGALHTYRAANRFVDADRWTLIAHSDSSTPALLTALGLARSPADARDGRIDLAPRLFLIDARARVRGIYDADDSVRCASLIDDARALQREIDRSYISSNPRTPP